MLSAIMYIYAILLLLADDSIFVIKNVLVSSL